MVAVDLLGAGWPQTFSLQKKKKKEMQQRAIEQGAAKSNRTRCACILGAPVSGGTQRLYRKGFPAYEASG